MLRSMTGFGRGKSKEGLLELTVDIKTLNHRYLDVYIRLPRQFMYLEEKIREKISNILIRGKIEVFINIEDFSDQINEVQIDENLASLYYDALRRIKDKFSLRDDISVSLLSRFPDVLKLKKSDKIEDVLWKSLEPILDEALESLLIMREKEGLALKDSMIEKIGNIETKSKEIIKLADNITHEYKEKLVSRLGDLLDNETIDQNRVATEIAIFADRCCIDEEIVRMESHVNQFKEILTEGVGIGKKLDFLIQEMIREVNTMGSKSSDVTITKTVVEIKSEIEKIREQVQNIE